MAKQDLSFTIEMICQQLSVSGKELAAVALEAIKLDEADLDLDALLQHRGLDRRREVADDLLESVRLGSGLGI